jgi:hypothetical protein
VARAGLAASATVSAARSRTPVRGREAVRFGPVALQVAHDAAVGLAGLRRRDIG